MRRIIFFILSYTSVLATTNFVTEFQKLTIETQATHLLFYEQAIPQLSQLLAHSHTSIHWRKIQSLLRVYIKRYQTSLEKGVNIVSSQISFTASTPLIENNQINARLKEILQSKADHLGFILFKKYQPRDYFPMWTHDASSPSKTPTSFYFVLYQLTDIPQDLWYFSDEKFADTLIPNTSTIVTIQDIIHAKTANFLIIAEVPQDPSSSLRFIPMALTATQKHPTQTKRRSKVSEPEIQTWRQSFASPDQLSSPILMEFQKEVDVLVTHLKEHVSPEKHLSIKK